MADSSTLLERLSKLEKDIDELNKFVKTSRFIKQVSNVISDEHVSRFLNERSCDDALVIKGSLGDLLLLALSFAYASYNSCFHDVEDDRLSRKLSFGYDEDNDGFAVEHSGDDHDKQLLLLTKDLFKSILIRDNTISSYDSVVIDSNGVLGIPASDKDKKEDIKEIGSVLGRVMKVKPVSFRWKDNKKKAIGFLNEDLKKYFNISIHEIISLIAVLWKAIQELNERVCEQSSQNINIKEKEEALKEVPDAL